MKLQINFVNNTYILGSSSIIKKYLGKQNKLDE